MTKARATDATEWIDALALPRHAALPRALVEYGAADPAVRFIELCCSVARGAGDELSDLDLGIGIADEEWPMALDRVPTALGRLGPLADLLDHEIASWAGVPHRRYFAQYEDGAQIDLVVMPASRRDGMPEASVALYDPDGRLTRRLVPRQQHADAADVREWVFEALIALLNLDKYLRRGSVWEALEQLHQARTYAWRLWAVTQDVAYPGFGLTAVLDADGVGPPPWLEATVPRLSADELRAAGRALLDVVTDIGPAAASRVGVAYPRPMAELAARRWRAD